MNRVNRIKWDGHTHTEFCRHGSPEPMEAYIERAIALGFQRYSLTEHPPLPEHWIANAAVMDELAMPLEDLQRYLDRAWACKQQYADKIEVLVGLELDYLHGAESFSYGLLEQCGHRLEDLVVSVHFLPGKDGMRCVDLSAEDFADAFLEQHGSMQAVAETYFQHVETAIRFAADVPLEQAGQRAWHGCKRVGHIGLIEKFRTALPALDEAWLRDRIASLLDLLASTGVGVDVNTAGFRKPTCAKAYVPDWFVRECMERGIPCVFGSDAHDPKDVGARWDWYVDVMQSF